jgi:hypothetical protein
LKQTRWLSQILVLFQWYLMFKLNQSSKNQLNNRQNNIDSHKSQNRLNLVTTATVIIVYGILNTVIDFITIRPAPKNPKNLRF